MGCQGDGSVTAELLPRFAVFVDGDDKGVFPPSGNCAPIPASLEDRGEAQRTSFCTLDNWGHKTPNQSKKRKNKKEKVKGSWPETHTIHSVTQ